MPSLAALGLVALVLLPGLLVVRAPWTAVPALSLSFWAVSAWWLGAGGGRGRFVSSALLVFTLLSLLRLVPKHEVPPPPGSSPPPVPPPPPRPGLPPPPLRARPSLLVASVALALLAAGALSHHAPGARLAFATATARLLLWRDGIPRSAEPLLPLAPVGAHAPALATLAADLSALSGLDPAPAVLLVLLAATGLLLVGLFSLHATGLPPGGAALGALVGLAVVPWPGAFRVWGEGEAILALALALPAAALLVGHASRSSAVAAALLLAGSALAHPCLAATALVLAVAVAAKQSPREGRSRLVLAPVLSVFLAAPGLVPLARALSLREAVAILPSIRPDELLLSLAGLLVVAVAPVVVLRVSSRWPRPRFGLALGLGAGMLLVVGVHGWIAAGQLPPPWRGTLERASAATPFVAVLCAPEPARDWIPALAGRASGDPGPWIPPVYAEEWARRPVRPCEVDLDGLRTLP